MSNIWKINPIYTKHMKSYIDDLYFCSYCCKYIDSRKFKSLLINEKNPLTVKKIDKMTCNNNYIPQTIFCKCYFCDRFISGILNGPDIFTFLKSVDQNNIQESLLNNFISKISVWYYNSIYDDFAIDLRKNLNFSKEHVKNISESIHDLKGLPSKEIINTKANELTNIILYNIS